MKKLLFIILLLIAGSCFGQETPRQRIAHLETELEKAKKMIFALEIALNDQGYKWTSRHRKYYALDYSESQKNKDIIEADKQQIKFIAAMLKSIYKYIGSSSEWEYERQYLKVMPLEQWEMDYINETNPDWFKKNPSYLKR
jgi:biotin operon repressor